MVDQYAVALGLPGMERLLQSIQTESVCMELLTRQPKMHRAYTSITTATYSQPCQVETYVKSETHNWLGRLALKTD